MSEGETWWALATSGLMGILLGMLWSKWMVWDYIGSKTPDAAGWRTAFHLRGKFYYIVTEREYVNKVMGPLPDGARIEIGDNYTRYSSGMPLRSMTQEGLDAGHRERSEPPPFLAKHKDKTSDPAKGE